MWGLYNEEKLRGGDDMIGHYFDQTFEHHKYGTTTDSWGNTTEAWTKQTDDINCRFRPLSGDRVVRDNAQNVIANAKFYMAADESVEVGDQLRNGDHYEITAIIDPMSMNEFLQVEARLI